MGEDLMSALHREVLEESGLKITSQPEKVCQFTEYFYDIDSNTGWESNRIFYKVSGVEGDVVLHGNGDDIVKAKYSQNPLEDESISPVSREVLTVGG